MKKLSIILNLFLFISFLSCKKTTSTTTQEKKQTQISSVKYANGFDIISENGNKFLVIKRVFQTDNTEFKYKLGKATNIKNNEIKVPVTKLVATSTTQIPMLELLGVENKIVAFPHTKYISSAKTRKLIDNGKIKEIGSEQNMNIELLLDIYPELVVGFSLHPNNKVYENIKKAGIPVMYNGEWLEETPLGRAEWIKFFGVLFNKEKKADSIFKSIEKNYLDAKKIASLNKNRTTVMSGSMFKDVWNVPAGESFIATFFKDANLDYIWKNSKGTGSLQLNFENVLNKAQNADFWIGAGMFRTKQELENTNNHYNEFKTFKENKIFGIGNKRGPTGGLIYFELSPVRPDLVLKDIIKITNPNVLKDYELTFFNPIQ